MWNQRYSSNDYVYGKEANTFLQSHTHQLKKPKVLNLAEGEGRNAVFLAQNGFEVTGVDSSEVGLKKAQNLAKEKSTHITTILCDLATFDFKTSYWDSIISIFCHLPPALRQSIHAQCVKALKPGGIMLIEAYTPEQLNFKTGGPPTAELMMSKHIIAKELSELEPLLLQEITRDVNEGQGHHGKGAVVQAILKKTQ